MNIKTNTLKVLPFFVSVISGLILFAISKSASADFKSLLINISASLLAIPLVFMFYQMVQKFSNQTLNVKIMDYAKLQIDTEILSIINQLQKVIYPLDAVDNTLSGINKFSNLSKQEITTFLTNNKYLGFQIFKHFEITEHNIEKALEHPLILNIFNNELLICIITILQKIASLKKIQTFDCLYLPTGEVTEDYKIVKGSDLNESNEKYPDRYILFKAIGNDNYEVKDFGDIDLYNLNKSLRFFKITPEWINSFTNIIYDLIQDFNTWGKLTGKKFIIDTNNFNFAEPQDLRNKIGIK